MSSETDAGGTFLAPALIFSLIIHALVLAIPRALHAVSAVREPPAFADQSFQIQIVVQANTAIEAPVTEIVSSFQDTPSPLTAEPAPVVTITPTADALPPPLVSGAVPTPPLTIKYLQQEQLTEMPQILGLGNLDLPGVVKPGDKGRLVLDILLSDQGKVDGVQVLEASVSPAFMTNAVRVFQWAEYAPGMELDRPMPSRLRIEVTLDANSVPRVSSQTRAFTTDGR